MENYVTGYDQGTILLPSGAREDVVLVIPGNAQSAILYVTGFNIAPGTTKDIDPVPEQVIINFNIGATPQNPPYTIMEGDPLRKHLDVLCPVVSIKNKTTTMLLDPPMGANGSSNPIITFTNVPRMNTSIDNIQGMFDSAGADYTMVPHIDSSRFTSVCDVLELSIQNTTNASHPFHLHGFSVQPCKIESINPTIGDVIELKYTWDYNEFVDIIHVPPSHRVTFRVQINDRLKIDGSHGGAIGRWLFHCHIVLHSIRGMISELVVLPLP